MNATQYKEFRPFEVHISSELDAVRVAPSGEVDLATTDLLRQRIGVQVARGSARLVLDLHDVTFMDSTGVRLMLDLAHTARRDRWDLLVIRVPHGVRRVFELSGVLDAIPLGEPEAV